MAVGRAPQLGGSFDEYTWCVRCRECYGCLCQRTILCRTSRLLWRKGRRAPEEEEIGLPGRHADCTLIITPHRRSHTIVEGHKKDTMARDLLLGSRQAAVVQRVGAREAGRCRLRASGARPSWRADPRKGRAREGCPTRRPRLFGCCLTGRARPPPAPGWRSALPGRPALRPTAG